MPRDLFGDVSTPSISLGNRKWYTVPLSLFTHIAVIVPLVLVPLLASDVLPMPRYANVFVVSPTPPTPPPPPPPDRNEPPPRRVDPNVAPIEPPTAITPETPFEPVDRRATPEMEGIGVFSGGLDVVVPPAPPVAPVAPPAPQGPIRPGGQIQPPVRTHYVAPVYSAIAQAARVHGTVIIEAIIGPEGRVQDVRVLRSIPLLDQAATDAVRQWLYTPTRLNGVPVAVIMTVTVTFTLTR